jgi:elongation factor Ts
MATVISAKDVAALRVRTGAGMMDCKKALEETGGDLEKAVDLLRQRGILKGEKRAERGASEGVIGSYVHFNGKLAVLVELNCETDFVARTEDFQGLVRELAQHIAGTPTPPIAVSVEDVPADLVARERAIYDAQVAESGKPEAVRVKMVEGKLKKFFEERVLLEQPFVKDDKQKVGELVKALSGKTGEKVAVRRFVRWELGGA